MDLERFERLPIMGIIRGLGPDDMAPVLKAVMEAGLETLEITMNTPGAPGLIKTARTLAGEKMAIGAGTVLSKKELGSALSAGARFIVMPVLSAEVASVCLKKKIPFFPGALTPQEVFNAWKSGASMVKVFPAGVFGPSYIKELKGPFGDIKLMAVGGVKASNISDFFSSGADAVAFGGSVFKKETVDKKDFGRIYSEVSELVREVRKCAGRGA